ncbi:hypothetical protein BGZ76_008995 [Entomortierella beljakovae]|nr:hypothetical protein BGZ76_008995 [Entomortierella beljakovae]
MSTSSPTSSPRQQPQQHLQQQQQQQSNGPARKHGKKKSRNSWKTTFKSTPSSPSQSTIDTHSSILNEMTNSPIHDGSGLGVTQPIGNEFLQNLDIQLSKLQRSDDQTVQHESSGGASKDVKHMSATSSISKAGGATNAFGLELNQLLKTSTPALPGSESSQALLDDYRLKDLLGSISQSNDSTVSLWDYLKEELTAADFETTQELKRERVANFLSVPIAFEKQMIVFGYFVCLDSFLYTFTILPARFVLAAVALFRYIFSRTWLSNTTERVRLKSSQKCDLIKVALVVVACTILQSVDASRTYHFIRGQNAMKLYAIFNCLEIFDRLCCSFGQDILDSLFSKSTLGSHPPKATFTASRHALAHTMVLFYQMVTLNVAVNSYSNALLTLLISNQFVEIKGSVFKRFEKENLFQLSCSVLGCETLVDWLKHAFITKFNQIRPSVYGRFVDILSRDLVVGSPARLGGRNNQQQTFVDQSPMVSRRIGLAALPLACLVICVTTQTLQMVLSMNEITRAPVVVAETFVTSTVSFDTISFDWTMPAVDFTSGISVASSDIIDVLVSFFKFAWVVFGQGSTVLGHLVIAWARQAGISQELGRRVMEYAVIALACLATYACLVALKLLIGINLLGFAHHRYLTMESREDMERQKDHMMRESNAAIEEKAVSAAISGLLDGRGTGHAGGDAYVLGGEKRVIHGLDTIDRYTLFKSRIP